MYSIVFLRCVLGGISNTRDMRENSISTMVTDQDIFNCLESQCATRNNHESIAMNYPSVLLDESNGNGFSSRRRIYSEQYAIVKCLQLILEDTCSEFQNWCRAANATSKHIGISI